MCVSRHPTKTASQQRLTAYYIGLTTYNRPVTRVGAIAPTLAGRSQSRTSSAHTANSCEQKKQKLGGRRLTY
ncbi:hypothetical protein [Nostoc sp.]|uniref:hypothetical protein n=1 Tax=Nostoc sp. TaxID=1180 RepID=UPI002FF8C75C